MFFVAKTIDASPLPADAEVPDEEHEGLHGVWRGAEAAERGGKGSHPLGGVGGKAGERWGGEGTMVGFECTTAVICFYTRGPFRVQEKVHLQPSRPNNSVAHLCHPFSSELLAMFLTDDVRQSKFGPLSVELSRRVMSFVLSGDPATWRSISAGLGMRGGGAQAAAAAAASGHASSRDKLAFVSKKSKKKRKFFNM